jgi:NADH-quinone oxidoreductase subunit K
MTLPPLQYYLMLSAFLFSIGLAGALARKNAIMVLIGIELMLNAANLNFVAFWRFCPEPNRLAGNLFVLFSIAIAAAETAIGLAIIIALFRQHKTTDAEKARELRG